MHKIIWILGVVLLTWSPLVEAKPQHQTWPVDFGASIPLTHQDLRPWLAWQPPQLPLTKTSPAPSEDWPMPTRHVWTIVDGHPIVGTPRLDKLHVSLDHPRMLRLSWILTRYKVKERDLRRWNPGVDWQSLALGQQLLLWKRQEGVISQSVGKASQGKLLHGEPLPEGPNYVILFEHRAFGTYYAVSEIQRVMAAYHESYPKAEPLIIGDLSYRTGRRIKPHISHRSGRDVDITYPRVDKTPNFKRFHYIRRRNIDVDATLFLIKRMIESGMLEMLLIDRPIQRRLYKHAQAQGAPQAWLDAVFQYPRYAGGHAIIRHARGHDDHFHARFFCQPTDYNCK